MPQSFVKDPSDILTYQANWATWLSTDTIASVTWTVATGITNVATSNTTTTATIKLSGGTDGADYSVACKIVTAAGLTCERTITIHVRQQ